MSRLQQLQSPGRLSPFPCASALIALAWLLSVAGCGGITCPEGTSEVDGVCRFGGQPIIDEDAGVDPPADGGAPALKERCDGVDNDGNDGIDEDWPELGQACGEGGGRGECVSGEYVCSKSGNGVICEGAIEPVAELCDRKDNDCDGHIDEEVLAVKQEHLGHHATVVAVDGGFVVARLVVEMLRVETYGTDGVRTGHHDDLPNPSNETAFIESAAAGSRVLLALGQHRFYVIEAHVDSELVPIIFRQQRLHDDWDQGIDWGIYDPPYHPRVSAAPPRFVGHRDLITFALTPFSTDGLFELQTAPVEAKGVPYHAYFDVVGAFAAWEQNDNVRAGWLLDDGDLIMDIDIGRGSNPAIAMGEEGPGIAYLQSGKLLLTELRGVTLQCVDGGFCQEVVDVEPIETTQVTATGLARDHGRDNWVVAAGEQLLVVGRAGDGPFIKQKLTSTVGDEPPRRVDVAVSGDTAAIVQAGDDGDSVLTFMGCF